MIFFTSDLHFSHANVIKYCARPYSSVEEMNEALISNWNEVVGPEDTIYCLGDFSMAFHSVERYSNRLNGKKYLVPGNHDTCHSYHKKARTDAKRQEQIKRYEEAGWIVLPEQTALDIPGLPNFQMCHHPYSFVEIDCRDDKYAAWRPKDDGRWLLCGHVHEKWKVVGRMINVGVDQWGFKPVPLTEIEKIICTTRGAQITQSV